MRKKNALKSSVIGLIAKICTIVLGFINTRVFMSQLGVEIKGINGILTNCLGLLQLAEMGIGSAIIFALYQPLIDHNIKEIQILMRYYKKMYRVIGMTIIFLGSIMSLFLQFLITDSTYSITYIRIVFFIQLGVTASTYFLAYKRNLLYADQNMYISTIVDTIFYIVFTTGNIIFMYFFHSYILYLLMQVIQAVISNLTINCICDKKYPYLKEKIEDKYEKIDELKRNVRDIVLDKIGAAIYGSTDNIIISTFVGVVQVGYMSAYYQVLGIFNSLAMAITEPIQPILGNYVRDKKDSKAAYDLFLSYTFVRYCVANIFTVGMVVMVDLFITIWLGDGYVLEDSIPIMIAVSMYISIVHGPTGEFIIALGLFKSNRNLSFGGIFINLVTSIILAKKYGTIGVLIGTAIAQVYYWIARTFIVYKNYFKRNAFEYILKNIMYIAVVIFDIKLIKILSNVVILSNVYLSFVFKTGITMLVCITSIVIFFFYTKEFKAALEIINNYKKKK